MKKAIKIQCIVCGSEQAVKYSDEKYDGFRGSCPDCGSNWPES
ncbi:MAG: hypothetical protein ACREAF_04900 [Nitrosopumilaceae archaeon]